MTTDKETEPQEEPTMTAKRAKNQREGNAGDRSRKVTLDKLSKTANEPTSRLDKLSKTAAAITGQGEEWPTGVFESLKERCPALHERVMEEFGEDRPTTKALVKALASALHDQDDKAREAAAEALAELIQALEAKTEALPEKPTETCTNPPKPDGNLNQRASRTVTISISPGSGPDEEVAIQRGNNPPVPIPSNHAHWSSIIKELAKQVERVPPTGAVKWGTLNKLVNSAATKENTASAYLRKKLSRLNAYLKEKLSPPIEEEAWIQAEKGVGARLNPKVHWKVNRGKTKQRPPIWNGATRKASRSTKG
jgi:hypothetical protein